jgi:predicted nucleotide-binding protein
MFLRSSINSLQDVLERIKNRAYNKLVKYEEMLSEEQKKENVNIANNKNIFIIHGSDEARWRELKSIISDEFNLNPIVLTEQPDRSMTIIEKFEYYAEQCCYAFAIFTPDDIIERNGEKYFQARPNVIFELGWFCSFLGRKRVCIIFQDGARTDIFSDFQGVIQKRFYQKINEVFRQIKLELKDLDII